MQALCKPYMIEEAYVRGFTSELQSKDSRFSHRATRSMDVRHSESGFKNKVCRILTFGSLDLYLPHLLIVSLREAAGTADLNHIIAVE